METGDNKVPNKRAGFAAAIAAARASVAAACFSIAA